MMRISPVAAGDDSPAPVTLHVANPSDAPVLDQVPVKKLFVSVSPIDVLVDVKDDLSTYEIVNVPDVGTVSAPSELKNSTTNRAVFPCVMFTGIAYGSRIEAAPFELAGISVISTEAPSCEGITGGGT